MKFKRVLVANRGEIALRIIRACQQMGIESVLATSYADRDGLAAREADYVVCIGAAPATESYLKAQSIVMAAKATGADAVHPGYGFLSEAPELAECCFAENLVFIGPDTEHLKLMGNKLAARKTAKKFGLQLLPGSERVRTYLEAEQVAHEIGFPVILKAAAGGGGRGMKIINDAGELPRMFQTAAAEARTAFGNDTLYIERYISNARHIEVQVLGDSYGNTIHLGERDCSLQRRHQKLVEESPAPLLSEILRKEICEAGRRLAGSIGYRNAGTIEFVFDVDVGEYYFLEMNTRVQVEHPVTEMVTGVDVVQEQIRIAGGEHLRYRQADIYIRGHAIECRINAEDPAADFRPSPGHVKKWRPPNGPNVRLDTHCYESYDIPPYYDSLIAKLIVYGYDREEAIARMSNALSRFEISGVSTTLEFLQYLVASRVFKRGEVRTKTVGEIISEYNKL